MYIFSCIVKYLINKMYVKSLLKENYLKEN